MTRIDRFAVAITVPTVAVAGWLAAHESLSRNEAWLLGGGLLAYAYFSCREVEIVLLAGDRSREPRALLVDLAQIVGIPLAILEPAGIVACCYFVEAMVLNYLPVRGPGGTSCRNRLPHAFICSSVGSIAMLAVSATGGEIFAVNTGVKGATLAAGAGVGVHAAIWFAGAHYHFRSMRRPVDPAVPAVLLRLAPLVAAAISLLIVSYDPNDPERLLLALGVVVVLHESLRHYVVIGSRLRVREVELETTLDQLVAIRDREREELAVALHDGPLQNVLVAKLRAGRLVESLDDDVDAKELEALLDESVGEIREVMRGRLPPAFQPLRLDEAVRSECHHVLDRAGPALTVDVAVGTEPPEIRDVLLHVVREAVRNVAKHADASTCTVSIKEAGEQIELQVRDDGMGIDPASTSSDRNAHVGVMVMRRRVESIGGTLTVGPAPGGGTMVLVAIPTGRLLPPSL